MKNDSTAPISKLEDNHHITRQYDENITILRKAKAGERLEKNEWFACQHNNTSIAEGIKLEKLAGDVIVSKSYPYAAHLMNLTVVIVHVISSKRCWIFK